MSEMFICSTCNYKTNKKGNYNRHLKTKKHLIRIDKKETTFKCPFCDYETSRRNNYLRHMKSNIHDDELDEIGKTDMENQTNINKYKEPENIDFDNKLNKCMDKILEEQKAIKKMIPNVGNTIINNKLSINVFLNTECKKAMSIQQFLNQLKLSIEDLDYTKNNGYVEGITNVFVKQLADLDPKERPIHCSDKKRLQFYIKNTHTWEKDDDNKNINMAIGDVQKKQIQMLSVWDKENPGWETNDLLIMERLKIAKSIYGSVTEQDRDKDNKQIRKKISENIDLDITLTDENIVGNMDTNNIIL